MPTKGLTITDIKDYILGPRGLTAAKPVLTGEYLAFMASVAATDFTELESRLGRWRGAKSFFNLLALDEFLHVVCAHCVDCEGAQPSLAAIRAVVQVYSLPFAFKGVHPEEPGASLYADLTKAWRELNPLNQPV